VNARGVKYFKDTVNLYKKQACFNQMGAAIFCGQFFVEALPYRVQGPGAPGDSDSTDSASGAADI